LLWHTIFSGIPAFYGLLPRRARYFRDIRGWESRSVPTHILLANQEALEHWTVGVLECWEKGGLLEVRESITPAHPGCL
jgi:hypothetical protein